MATNAFDVLILDVNKKISEMNTAASNANSAAAGARDAVTHAQEATQAATEAAQNAQEAATGASEEANAWDKATAEATALAEGAAPTVSDSEADGVKKLAFGIPVGATGAPGKDGPAGKSGVTFKLEGTKLYITTD